MQLHANLTISMQEQFYPLVSIICPVYQAEKTLNDCLKSISFQKYQNWECIIIIDGATDASETIARRYSNIDSRFIIKVQTNKGRSAARNLGLSCAKGSWVTFIDSDDQILPTGLDAMMQIAFEYKTDIVYGNYLTKKGNTPTKSFLGATKGILNLNFARKANLNIERLGISNDGYQYDLFNCRTCWGKMYSYDLINKYKIHFPEELSIGEDTFFNYFALAHASRVAFTNEPVYVYNDVSKGTVRSFSSKDFISVHHMSRLFESLSRSDNFLAEDMYACVARDYLGVFLRGSFYTPLRCINEVSQLAKKTYDPFIHQALPLYISHGMKSSRVKFLYNKIRIWLIRHQFWRSTFLLQRIGGKLK